MPTALTWMRVAATPAFGGAFYANASCGPVPGALAIFAAAAITDWLDGVLARRWDAMTPFVAVLDPVADKAMVCTSLVLLCSRPPPALAAAPPWLLALPTCAIVGREIAVSALREWAATMPKAPGAPDVAIPVSFWGRRRRPRSLSRAACSFSAPDPRPWTRPTRCALAPGCSTSLPRLLSRPAWTTRAALRRAVERHPHTW